MQRMSISGAFADMVDFVRSSWAVIFGSMVVALLLSAGLGFALIGDLAQMFPTQAGGPPPDPTLMLQTIGLFYLVLLVASVLLYTAYFLSWRHGLSDGIESVFTNIGWAMGAAATSMLAMLVIGMAVTIALYLVILVIGLIVVAVLGIGGGLSADIFGAADGSGPGAGLIAGIFLFYALFLIGFYWIYGRFVAAGPAMAARRTVNPVFGLTESWRLTGPSQWKILAFLLIQLVIGIAAMVLVAIVGGTAAAFVDPASGPPSAPGAVSIVVMLLLYVPVLLMAVASPLAVYRQTTGTPHDPGDLFA
jgi:hypothetical protein